MTEMHLGGQQMFRVWVARCRGWQPVKWNDVPPQATALELVQETCLRADEAALLVEGFNRQRLHSAGREQFWAVAIPVVIRYEGDSRPGAAIAGHRFVESE